MKPTNLQAFSTIAAAILIAGCGAPTESDQPASQAPQPPASDNGVNDNTLALRAVGMQFQGPHEIKSGWTRIELQNISAIAHFALVYRLPDGVSAQMVSQSAAGLFQEILNLQNAGDEKAAAELMTQFPDWIGDIVFMGGPGLLAGGKSSSATIYLEPGRYVIECYVKTGGYLHNYSPDPQKLAMIHPLTVLDEDGGANEPEANVTLGLSSGGYEILSGDFRPGANSVRVKFLDQKVYPSMVGHDAHVFRINNASDLARAANWIDFMPAQGLQTPSPVEFLGGLHDMPAGSVGYFTVDLAPGDYVIISETPASDKNGLFFPFRVQE